MERNHWLYGKDKRKIKIDFESNCLHCIHKEVCDTIVKCKDTETLCLNYNFGNSRYNGCNSCLHRFTRFDKDKIPCFICKFYKENKNGKNQSNDCL